MPLKYQQSSLSQPEAFCAVKVEPTSLNSHSWNPRVDVDKDPYRVFIERESITVQDVSVTQTCDKKAHTEPCLLRDILDRRGRSPLSTQIQVIRRAWLVKSQMMLT